MRIDPLHARLYRVRQKAARAAQFPRVDGADALAASVGDEGKPVLATFTEDVPNGARLK